MTENCAYYLWLCDELEGSCEVVSHTRAALLRRWIHELSMSLTSEEVGWLTDYFLGPD